MIIGVDIKAFKNGTTGISKYLSSILDILQETDHINEYILFSPVHIPYKIKNTHWKIIVSPMPKFIPGIIWQQLILPFEALKQNINLLWMPEQTCPIFISNKIKIVTTIHDHTHLHFPSTMKLTGLLIQKIILKRTIKRSNAIITVSEYIKNDTLTNYKKETHNKKIISINNGAPSWKIPKDYNSKLRKPFLFFAGNQEPRKNLLSVIKALEILNNHGKSIDLHIAGPSGWKNKILYDYIKKSPIKQNIKLLGFISEKELQQQYLTCSALIYPSLYEGFGLPVLEALKLDCLVLTSQNTVMQEIAKNSALYFNPRSAKSIVKALETIYSPNFNRKKILKASPQILDNYSWSKCAHEHYNLFLEIYKT